jgi:hypothetical protein
MGKIIITEQQFKLLLEDETMYDTEKGKVLYHIGSIPTDKQQTPGAMQQILKSIGIKNGFPLFNDIDLTIHPTRLNKKGEPSILDIRNKMRFDSYFEAFDGARGYSRGHMWEGLFAGLFNGEVNMGEPEEYETEKADVILPGGGRFSLKFMAGASESPSVGNLGRPREIVNQIYPELAFDYKDLSIYDIFSSKNVDLIYKTEILERGFADIDWWIFGYDTKGRSIVVHYMTTDELIGRILDTPEGVGAPRTKYSFTDLRIKPRIWRIEGEKHKFTILFPQVEHSSYTKYLKKTPTEAKAEKLFATLGSRVDPEILKSIRKNPRPFIKRLHNMYGDRFNLGLTF